MEVCLCVLVCSVLVSLLSRVGAALPFRKRLRSSSSSVDEHNGNSGGTTTSSSSISTSICNVRGHGDAVEVDDSDGGF